MRLKRLSFLEEDGTDPVPQCMSCLLDLSTPTRKKLGVDPQACLRDALDRISTHPARRIEVLLPDNRQAFRQAGDSEHA